MGLKASLLDGDSQRSAKYFKAGMWALVGGSCLVLLSVMAVSSYNSSAAESTNLFAKPTSLRTSSPVMPMSLRNLGGSSPWKELTLAAIEDQSGHCNRDVSMNAIRNGDRVKSVMASLSPKDKAMVTKAEGAVVAKGDDLLKAGVVAPLGFFDPSGFSTDVSEGRLLFFREAEIKHGRVCMLAFVGILVGEQYHPLFGGNIDIPAAQHFTLTGGDIFWVAAYVQFLFAAFWEERRTSFPVLEGKAFTGLMPNDSSEVFAAKSGRIPGDLGFDPLGLKPKKEADLLGMQNKEILNGRLAMIAVVGIIAQELVTGQKVFR